MKLASKTNWIKVGETNDFPLHLGISLKINDIQIAIFRLPTLKTWYAIQDFSSLSLRTAFSRGIVGDRNGIPFVSCPLHNHSYNLETGVSLSGENIRIKTFPIKEDKNTIFIKTESFRLKSAIEVHDYQDAVS